MTCRNAACGREIGEGFAFCPHCGAVQASLCSGCAAPLAAGFAFCPRCGASAAASGPAPKASAAIPTPAPGGERRVVTVLFADVAGFTRLSERLDPELVTGMINHLFSRCGALVRQFDGRVDKQIGDALMVLFGAPIAHEDDPERALLTALEMQAQLPAINGEIRARLGVDHPLQLHIGIATGLVVAGTVGSGGYTVMGDAVNLAARLVDLALPGEIMIADETRKLVRGRIECEMAQTVKVKGKEEPVAVYRVVGRALKPVEGRGLADFTSPLVGRDAELAALQAAGRCLEEGRGGLFAIQGEAGVGKSRLLKEWLQTQSLHELQPRIHTGRCISYGGSVPYFLWSQLLAGLTQEFATAVAEPEPGTALRELLSGNIAPRSAAEAELHRSRVFAAIPALLAAAALTAPRILVLEDIHWADASSLELLAAIAPALARERLLVVVIFRQVAGQDLFGRFAPRLESGAAALNLKIGPLDAAATRVLAAHLTHAIRDFAPRHLEEICKRSGGMPLFVEEILRAEVESGMIVADTVAGGWRWVAPAAGERAPLIPTTLHGLLAAKIDRLPAPLRARLDIASVIGTDFDPHFIEQLVAEPVDDAWRQIEASGEIVCIPGDRALPLYRFTHALTREIVYSTLLKSRRQELHRMIATVLAANTGRIEQNLHALAWHFEQADEKGRASVYWLAAARQAAGLYANLEALELFDQALACLPAGLAQGEALREKAALLRHMGRNAEAVAAVETLIAIGHEAGDASLEVRMLCERAYLAYILGDGEGILRFAKQALACAKVSGQAPLLARAWRYLGVGHEFAGRFPEAEAAYQEVLRFSEQSAEIDLIPSVYNSLGEIARAGDRFTAAVGWYVKATAAQERFRPGVASVGFLNNLGAAYVGLGEYSTGLSYLLRYIDEKRRQGYEGHLSESYYFSGVARLGLKQMAQAAADAAQTVRLARQHGEQEMLGLALRLCGELREQGAPLDIDALPATAADCLRESIRIFQQAGKQGEEARSRWKLAGILRRDGAAAQADAEFGQAIRLFSALQLDIPLEKVKAEAGG